MLPFGFNSDMLQYVCLNLSGEMGYYVEYLNKTIPVRFSSGFNFNKTCMNFLDFQKLDRGLKSSLWLSLNITFQQGIAVADPTAAFKPSTGEGV